MKIKKGNLKGTLKALTGLLRWKQNMFFSAWIKKYCRILQDLMVH
jgi:hypothetical protein